jgi:hypothetical protein
MFALANLQEQFELLGEQLVVVLEPEAKQRKGFNRRPTAHHHFRAALREQIESGELLEDANGIGGAEPVTALVRRMRRVRAAAAARMMAGAESRYS